MLKTKEQVVVALTQEKADLDGKIGRAKEFMQSSNFSKLSKASQHLLVDQVKYMKRYSTTLGLRILYAEQGW